MYKIAYDKQTKRVLGFIENNNEINIDEVFKYFSNYDVIETENEPPLVDFENYTIDTENKLFARIETIISELQAKKNQLSNLKARIKETNDTLLEFLEGELSITEYAQTKLERKNLRTQIKNLEAEIKEQTGADANG